MVAASSVVSGSMYTRSRAVTSRVRTYNWPPIQLNFWIFVMLLASTSILGVFAIFIQTQNQLQLPVPWYFPYFITVCGLTILFILGLFWLIFNRRLLPAIVMIGAFILFVLWVTGLVIVSIQLFGPEGSVSSNCDIQVFSQNPKGQTLKVLAYLQQKNICESWRMVFAMALIGTIFLLWIMIMAYQVFVNS
ncbi:uncharacterized protein J7T54_005338 [Emericellopsis cladophorae]|uniref:MARVEL domain-containing protein n=1 Tax=Emericellopsis cladophorae TaxID=2686198 RepID=A0A9Q0BAL4_9HYPO|nr:uncharacterized protein J7T54_005338 [Emericellopsis cladophorae]KAI6778432.1 hypothetical protein J7T54_005338 [Emericellopsis cladophorae]